MLVLVLDTATPAITAAVASVIPAAKAGAGPTIELVAGKVTVDARAHGELLAPQIADVLSTAGAGPRDLAAIVAGLGPGPFTGLRVGLVTAAAMADTLSIPAYGVCTLDAFATGDRILVATDARRKEVYWACYAGTDRLSGPSVDRPDNLTLPAGLDYAVGDGALRYAAELRLPVWDEPRFPPAIGLVGRAAERIVTGASGETLVPLYLRRPDAMAPGTRKPALARSEQR